MSHDPTNDQPNRSGADRDPVEMALAAAATAPVTIDPERLAALEARVIGALVGRDGRGAVVALGSASLGSVRRPSRGRSCCRRLRWCSSSRSARSTLVLLAGDDDALAIAAADRVVVELPDGESVAGEAGTELPDGSRLEVIGFVEIDGRRFGPGSYRIVDGEVVGSELTQPATSEVSEGLGDDRSGSRPAQAGGDGVDGDGVDLDGSVRTTVVGSARSDDEPEQPAPDDGRDGTVDDGTGDGGTGGGGADRPVVPRPTDSPRTTTPQRPLDVTRPTAPTTVPVREPAVPARPATTVPSERPTTTARASTSPTTTATTTTTRTHDGDHDDDHDDHHDDDDRADANERGGQTATPDRGRS